jgi:hypothetical protein
MISLKKILLERADKTIKFDTISGAIAQFPDAKRSWEVIYKVRDGIATVKQALNFFTSTNVSDSAEFRNDNYVFVVSETPKPLQGKRKSRFIISAIPASKKPKDYNTKLDVKTTDGITFYAKDAAIEDKPVTDTDTTSAATTTPNITNTTTASTPTDTQTADTTNVDSNTIKKIIPVRSGQRGEAVKAAQKFLIKKLQKTPISRTPAWTEFMKYGADGIYGVATSKLIWGLHKVYELSPSIDLTQELIAKLETLQEQIKLKSILEQNWDEFNIDDFPTVKRVSTVKTTTDDKPAADRKPITRMQLYRELVKMHPYNFKLRRTTPSQERGLAKNLPSEIVFDVTIGDTITDKDLLVALKKLIVTSGVNVNEDELLSILQTLSLKDPNGIDYYKTLHAQYNKLNGSELAADLRNAFDSNELAKFRDIATKQGYTYQNFKLVKQDNTTGKTLSTPAGFDNF